MTTAVPPSLHSRDRGAERRLVIGIGELALADGPNQTIVTHALGSCVAVCLFDPVAGVAGMLHFLLPEAMINPERARQQPGAFVDTGLPLLLRAAARRGLERQRTLVSLVGGAGIGEAADGALSIGRRNALAATYQAWRHGLFITSHDLGGNRVRTVHLSALDGRVRIFDGLEQVKEL